MSQTTPSHHLPSHAASAITVEARQALERAQELTLAQQPAAAIALLQAALDLHPGVTELRVALAGLLRERGALEPAEQQLRQALVDQPDHTLASIQLAKLLRDQGRPGAAAEVLQCLGERAAEDIETLLLVIELLSDCDRHAQAAAICERAIALGNPDERLRVHAGGLCSQLGQFEQARAHHAHLLRHSPRALEWHCPLALAEIQRYRDPHHPDFAAFRALQQRPMSEAERAGLAFALGKAHDDIGAHAEAAGYWRQANAIRKQTASWSRKLWRRSVEQRLAQSRRWPEAPTSLAARPLFIVGAPRSGTTLLAQCLARHPQIVNRGELRWLPQLAGELGRQPTTSAAELQAAARLYARQLQQDDGARGWLIDKQPHNLMHVDLILAMFPQARIIQCLRQPRDNALSLWAQSFHPGTQEFAYDWQDIAAFLQGCRRLSEHWQRRFPASVTTVPYERLVAEPEPFLASLLHWLELPADPLEAGRETQAISTASVWQARQPVYTRAVERWKAYLPHIPELAAIGR
jgi:tetratricopeptide (TPR) repeat protein